MPDRPLFQQAWRSAWMGLGAWGDGETLYRELLGRYGEPHRHYHTQRHLRDSLLTLDSVCRLAERPSEVAMALWFHDAVYDPKAGDNESRSAEWAETVLLAAGVAVDIAGRVANMVLATRHAAVPSKPDERLIADVDLAILGASRMRFDEYESEIRREYAWVPWSEFRGKRRRVLEHFLRRPSLYGTPHFQQTLERQARVNLARSVARLR